MWRGCKGGVHVKNDIQIPIKLTDNPIFLIYFCCCSYIFWSSCAGQTVVMAVCSVLELSVLMSVMLATPLSPACSQRCSHLPACQLQFVYMLFMACTWRLSIHVITSWFSGSSSCGNFDLRCQLNVDWERRLTSVCLKLDDIVYSRWCLIRTLLMGHLIVIQ